MVKNKNTPTQRHKITTMFGYSLFGLLVVSFLASTAVPMTSVMFQYPNARHFNISVMIIVFAIATIMPALVAYFIGDSTTRSKKETLHRYNGVLFGFATFWLVTFIGWLDFSRLLGLNGQAFPASLVATNVPPVVITLIVVTILAVVFAKKQKSNTSVLQFFPYKVTLILSIIGAVVAPYIIHTSSINPAGAVFLAVPAIVTVLSYAILKKQSISKSTRLTDALIAMSIGWIAISCIQTLADFTRLPYQISSLVSYVIAFAILALYLYLRVRK